jgi:polyisoprenoid-binding protein YceI
MNRQLQVISGILVAIAVVAIAALGYIYLRGGTGAVSAPIAAPTLAANDGGTGTQKVYRIDPEQSEVRFTLDELLMGNPNTVIGKTNQVTGDILLDLTTPSQASIGEIRINARSIATDSGMRDRMMRGEILQSSQENFEFIVFKTTSITGLPEKVAPGEEVNFKITGDLTIRDITKPVTFDVKAKLVSGSPDRLEGSASAVVKRADYGLEIPRVPSVADVTDEVKLDIDFKAVSTSGA